MSHLSRAVEETAEAAAEHAEQLADAVARRGWGVATAESLTGGTIASVLAAAPAASQWLRGGIVAYTSEVKFDLLGVPRGPVVTEECARTMAQATATLLRADLCVAVTGVGGPDPDEGEPAGTVWFCVVSPGGVHTEKRVLPGSPADVLTATTVHAMSLLLDAAVGTSG